MTADPVVLYASQPTRGVDIGAIEFIHRELRELSSSGCGILLTSFDLDELLELSDRIVVFYRGAIAGEFTAPSFDRDAIGFAMVSGYAPDTDDTPVVRGGGLGLVGA